MRIDGELVRVTMPRSNWREFHKGQDEVLVKTMHGVALFEDQALSSPRGHIRERLRAFAGHLSGRTR